MAFSPDLSPKINLLSMTTDILKRSLQDTVKGKKINTLYLAPNVDISRLFLYSSASSERWQSG